MKNYVVNHANYWMGIGNPQFEVFEKPSLTVPGQVMPISEIVERYTQGRTTNAPVFSPEYTQDPLLDGIEQLDRMERITRSRELAEAITVRQAWAAKKKQKEQEERDAKAARAIEQARARAAEGDSSTDDANQP